MNRICGLLAGVSWGLGVVSLVGGLALKVASHWADRLSVSPRGAFVFAGVLFLCTLATRALEQGSGKAAS
jgi:hypothetical protein